MFFCQKKISEVDQLYFTDFVIMRKMTYNEFDTKMRNDGYTFSEKTINSDNTTYHYYKKLYGSELVYTQTMQYSDYKDGKPVIGFSCVSTIYEYLINRIKKGCEIYGLSETDYNTNSANIQFCYSSNSYKCTIAEKNAGDYNKILISMFQR